MSSHNVAFASCSRISSFKFSRGYERARTHPLRLSCSSVGLLWLFSLFHSLSLSLSLLLFPFPRYWDALDGISSSEDATFRINRAVGLESESRMEDPWRARFQPRLPGSMRNAGSDEKEDWLETEFESAGRRRYAGGKSRLTIRGSSLRPLCPPLRLCLFLPLYLSFSRFSSAEFPMRGIMRGICSRNFQRWSFVNDSSTKASALRQTRQFRHRPALIPHVNIAAR